MSGLPRAVSFDLDGTLYETRRAAWRLVARLPHRLRFLAAYKRVRQRLRQEVFEDGDAFQRVEADRLGQALGCTAEEAARRLHHVHEVEIVTQLGAVGPDPWARPLLRGLIERGVAVAVLSDLPVDAKLAALGLGDLAYGCTLDAGETGALKPHRRPFERVAKALGVPLDAMVHVGDRHDTDVVGAERCGAQAVWLTRRGRQPVAAGTVMVRSLAELARRWELGVSP